MTRCDETTRKMTVEVRSKGDVRQWEQRLTGLPRRGDRLRWTCHQNEETYLVEAEVKYLLWMTDDISSERLQPTVVCKLVSVSCEDETDDDEDWDCDDWPEDRAYRDDEVPDDEDDEDDEDDDEDDDEAHDAWTDLLT